MLVLFFGKAVNEAFEKRRIEREKVVKKQLESVIIEPLAE